MGTPDFAVPPLELLIDNGYDVVAVITAPDKPAGRGQKLRKSAVKLAAEKNGLKVLQPTNLKSSTFIEELSALNANLQIIVAFRMLPEVIWNMPTYGTFNLHASLLPQYRGAAPINWAIINGEKESGVTTFFLDQEIDTGKVILSEKVAINDTDTAGILHDKLMVKGAVLVLKTVQQIEKGDVSTTKQSDITPNTTLKSAPKIFREDCKINWNKSCNEVFHLIKGLSPYPGAWSELINLNSKKVLSFKIFDCAVIDQSPNKETGIIQSDGKSYIHIHLNDGVLELNEIQIAGKKRMQTNELLKGFNIKEYDIIN